MTVRELLGREIQDYLGERFDDAKLVRAIQSAVRGVLFHAGLEEEDLLQRLTDAVRWAVLEVEVYDCCRVWP
jgi:hypothetical protein